jgi:hypothetical protein
MPVEKYPPSPIPPSLRGADPNSFTRHTIEVRLPTIARRTLDENAFSQKQINLINQLIDEIPHTPLRSLKDPDAPDAQDWERYLDQVRGQNWLEVSWFFAEAYFYRRILEATGYFTEGPGKRLDPYIYQKQAGLKIARPQIEEFCARLNAVLPGSGNGKDVGLSDKSGWDPSDLGQIMQSALWGNQVDLSLWPAGQEQKPDHASLQQASSFLLVDHTDRVVEALQANSEKTPRIEILIDNAGFELVCDLGIASYLLSWNIADQVCLHVKSHPTFVSDVIRRDVISTVSALSYEPGSHPRLLASRLQEHLARGRLQIQDHYFWTSPLPAWEMPSDLRAELAASVLVISKGDAHYRRSLGDRHWPYTFPYEEIVRYYPAPLLSLRTLKSEVAAGLDARRIEAVKEQDPDWIINGRWGVIQFYNA